MTVEADENPNGETTMKTTAATLTDDNINETLASKTGAGLYGWTWESRLVRWGGKHYIVHDHFCGGGSLEGGAYRAFVYEVPGGRVEEVKALYAAADWHRLTHDVLPTLESYGRASRLAWPARRLLRWSQPPTKEFRQ